MPAELLAPVRITVPAIVALKYIRDLNIELSPVLYHQREEPMR
jgi:hypothetical protein